MTFHRKVARTENEFQRILFALLLHNTVPVKLAISMVINGTNGKYKKITDLK